MLRALPLLILLSACSGSEPSAPQEPSPSVSSVDAAKPVESTAPAGHYTLDKAHASLTFTVNHLGYSMYTAQFRSFDATLDFDPADPAATRVQATVDLTSLSLPNPPDGFHETLMQPAWLDALAHPQLGFSSTSVESTGPDTAILTGDLTFRGVTKPVTLNVRFNGGYPGFRPYDPQARIGFSASGAFNRSEFGMTEGVPPQGSLLGVSDEVRFWIEAEFNGPATPETG